MGLEYVDLETAKAARGTRIVVTSLVPSPWSEATKGLLQLAGLDVLAVARTRMPTRRSARRSCRRCARRSPPRTPRSVR